jgi:hypothetical protein
MKKLLSLLFFVPITFLTHAQNVGIGTNNPTQKLQVAGNAFIQDSVGIGVANPQFKLDVGGRMRLRSEGVVDGTAGTWYNNQNNTQTPAFWGMFNDSTLGFYGQQNGWSTFLSTKNGNMGIGVGLPTSKLHVRGSLRIDNGTQGVNKVLVSDLAGNATWQDLITPDVHLSALSMSTTNIPSLFPNVLTNWNNLDEGGGTNWNATTGEYTITVAGYYSATCNIQWGIVNASANIIGVYIYVNNAVTASGNSSQIFTSGYPSDTHVHFEKRLNVGDKIKFSAFQNSGGPVITGNLSNFGIHLIHK